ncbi:MAG: HAD-IIIC family phosphatase [Alphaproteobacteria bacterium]|nr:HAD-IIIC family phosphatase [Alphaproteobacteria bacterium]
MTPTGCDVLLLGRCGLQRVADALQAAGLRATVAGWSDVQLVARLQPALVYVDLFEWTTTTPWVAAGLRGGELPVEGDGLRAVIDALAAAPVLYRGVRGAPAMPTAGPRWPDPLDGLPVLDVAGLWARHGILADGVRFGPGHGEAELGDLGRSRLDGRTAAQVEADAVRGHWLARTRGPRKCVVVDLDDTLIHGRIADDGFVAANPAWQPAPPDVEAAWWRAPRGIHLALRELQRRGVLLALATRNDPAVVAARFRRPRVAPLDLLLDQDDFVAVEAGFGDKAAMLRAIAAGLGFGTDQLVFVDDRAVEREQVADVLPEVRCLDAGDAAWRLPELPELTVQRPSPQGALRAGSYKSRAAVHATPADRLHAFLAGLQLVARVRPATEADLPRVRELLARTRQLVLTGARPAPTTVEGLWVAEVRDRIADHGLVCAGLFAGEEEARRLVAWACSCRVLPHRVAASLLARMWEQEPGVRVVREDTGHNGATAGLVEEASAGFAPWVRFEA